MELRFWSDADLDVLRAINTPSMKRHLGGPEAEEQLLRRHGRYVEETANGALTMYVIRTPGAAAGGDQRMGGTIASIRCGPGSE